jgi:hypothetical protein
MLDHLVMLFTFESGRQLQKAVVAVVVGLTLYINNESFLVQERHTKVVGHERGHDLTIIRLNNSTEDRDGSGDGLFAQESEDTKLSKTAVVDLGTEAGLLLISAHVLAELEGIEKVEGDGMGNSIRATDEVGVVTGPSTSHVVLVGGSGELTPELKETDEREDLPLCRFTHAVP